MNQKRIEKIIKMENILNETNQVLADLELALEKYKNLKPEIKKLTHYYEKWSWNKDYEASENWKIPENIPQWVLSQDAIWDALTLEYWLAKEMQKISKNILKR